MTQIIPVNFGMVNSYILKEGENAAIVDCGVTGCHNAILQAAYNNGLKNDNIKLIILTHGHTDHIGSCSELRKITGAQTIIHEKDADIIKTGIVPKLKPTYKIASIIGKFVKGKMNGFEPYNPEIIINDEISLSDYGFSGRIIMTPGHTYGSVSVLLENGCIIVGDLFMGGFFIKGKPKYPMFLENLELINKSIEKVISLKPEKVYCGHGGPFSFEEIKDFKLLSM